MKKRTTILLYFLMGLIMLATSGCGTRRATFTAVNVPPQVCSIQDGMIVCPDGTSALLPSNGQDGADGVDGADGKDGVNAVIYSQTVVDANTCTEVGNGLYVENIQQGRIFDVYFNDQCRDNLGEHCDNVAPSFGSSGQFGDGGIGSGDVCWADRRQVSGERIANGGLLIRVLEF
jgi:hypothetical protein